MAADFVDSIDVLNRAMRRIQSLHGLIARGADRFCNALIDCVVRVKREHLFPGRIEDDFAERNAAQLLVFIQQPGNQLIHCRFAEAGGGDSSRAADDCASAAPATNVIAIKAMNLIHWDSKSLRVPEQESKRRIRLRQELHSHVEAAIPWSQ